MSKISHHSSFLKSDIDSEVESAKSKEWDDSSDDELSQVVVVEDVVDVKSKVCRKNPDDSLVDDFRLVGVRV